MLTKSGEQADVQGLKSYVQKDMVKKKKKLLKAFQTFLMLQTKIAALLFCLISNAGLVVNAMITH